MHATKKRKAQIHLTLRQLRIFAEVARAGSTMAAAREIALSQSATSAALNELESLLGGHLFNRVGRRLVLNEHGRSMLPQAQWLLDAARAMESQFGKAGRSSAPRLRIAASTTIGNYVLPKVIAAYRREENAAQVAVEIGNTRQVAKAVADFEVDLGFIEGPTTEPLVAVLPWMTDELVIACSPRHPLARRGGPPQGLARRAEESHVAAARAGIGHARGGRAHAATAPASAEAYGAAHHFGRGSTLAIGALAAVSSLVLFYCTAMIYACIKFLQEWASRFTIANFLLLGCASGFTLAVALAALLAPPLTDRYAIAAVMLTVAALATRLASLARNARIRRKSSPQTAIGVCNPKVRQISQGFSGNSFNTLEFFHGASPRRMRAVRTAFLLLAFILPVVLIAGGIRAGSVAVLAAAFVVQYAGLVLERWFFLAQSNHPQNLYYLSTS